MTPTNQTCREPECREPIVFLRTTTGARMPCDASSVGPGEWLYDRLKHVSHFKTCKNPRRFSGTNRRSNPNDQQKEDQAAAGAGADKPATPGD